jgi:Zn ribbon nucleic-acid-binding protein
MCDGSGYVCPTCTGLRWLGQRNEGDASTLLRCLDCGYLQGSAWHYDFDRELATVRLWLDRNQAT